MSASREERRLGLLKCPNAASRGWIGVAIDADHEANDAGGEGAAQAKAVAARVADDDVEKAKLDNVTMEGLDNGEAKREGIQSVETEDAAGAIDNGDGASPEQISESNLMDVGSCLADVAAANLPFKTTLTKGNAFAPRKRLRSDEGEVAIEIEPIEMMQTNDQSRINGMMADEDELDKQHQSKPDFHDSKETTDQRIAEVQPGQSTNNETNTNPLVVSIEYETKCSCLHCKTSISSKEQDSSSASTLPNLCTNEKGQIVTISYICNQESTVVSVASISGKAKIELLPTLLSTERNQTVQDADLLSDQQKGDMKGGLYTCNSGDDDDELSLDIFGYRLSHSTAKEMEIDRPEWMNALPLSIVCPAVGQDSATKKLRVRIKSIRSGKGNGSIREEECYYGAHPEETYQLSIYYPTAKTTGNNAINERKSGITFISDPWRNVADKIVNAIENSRRSLAKAAPPAAETQEVATAEISTNNNRILVCGAKGVGKSTFLRYMTNRMLSTPNVTNTNKKSRSSDIAIDTSNQHIALLDLDSGQPELSPPGLLTLTVVSRPIVSDPPMHMVCNGRGSMGSYNVEGSCNNNDGIVEKVVASYFFGDVTSKSDPDTYIHIAKKLLCKYQELVASASTSTDKQPIPLLVNTDGWVKGLGYEILSAIVGASNPSHIVQILGNTKAKSFDMTLFHSGEDRNLQQQEQLGRRCCVHVIQSFDEYTNPVENGNKPYHRGSLDSTQSTSTGTLLATSSDHRAHRICAYFLNGCNSMSTLRSGIVGDDTSVCFHKEKGLVDPSNIIGLALASMLPYAVPFHSIKLYPPYGLLDSVLEVSPIWGIRADLACNDVLDSLAGSVVGLCCNPDLSDATNSNAGCGVPILPCVGLGIIRSIDQIRQIFYVLSPVHPELLCSVTSFVGGNVGLPFECVYRGVYSDSFPYQSFGQALTNAGLGSEVMQSRNHSGRKK